MKEINAQQQHQEFLDAASHLIKWLCENQHPHTTVIVTQTGAELLEGILSTGAVTKYLKE